jgi:hypothetical protein
MKDFKQIRQKSDTKTVSGNAVKTDKFGEYNFKLVKDGNVFNLFMNGIKFDSFASKSEAEKNYKKLVDQTKEIYKEDNK